MKNISKREPGPFRDSHRDRFAEPGSQRHQREKSNRFSTPWVQRAHGTDQSRGPFVKTTGRAMIQSRLLLRIRSS